ncbi:hypothetical protein [Bacteroides sp.]
MSNIVKLVEIVQPEYMGIKNRWTERTGKIESVCTYCKGSGWYWGEGEYGEATKKDCPCCEGSGKMQATVEVYWEPGKK